MIIVRSALGALASCIVLVTAGIASDRLEVAYPEGYRQWTHIRSAYVSEGHTEGLHNIYANEKAMEGYRRGQFPAGSVIVFDVLDASSSRQGIEPGSRKFIDVMWKSRNGGRGSGWLFGEFDRNSRTARNVTAAQGVAQCQACHSSAGATDGVFSKFVP